MPMFLPLRLAQSLFSCHCPSFNFREPHPPLDSRPSPPSSQQAHFLSPESTNITISLGFSLGRDLQHLFPCFSFSFLFLLNRASSAQEQVIAFIFSPSLFLLIISIPITSSVFDAPLISPIVISNEGFSSPSRCLPSPARPPFLSTAAPSPLSLSVIAAAAQSDLRWSFSKLALFLLVVYSAIITSPRSQLSLPSSILFSCSVAVAETILL